MKKILFVCIPILAGVLMISTNPSIAADAKLFYSNNQNIVLAKTSTKKTDLSQTANKGNSDSNACETNALNNYNNCLAKPGAKRKDCKREYNSAKAKCSLPATGSSPTEKTKKSEGLYRIPYADGTRVLIQHDFLKHNGPGKIDMRGRGHGSFRVVAADAGTIRYIVDHHTKQQHPERILRNSECTNNYVWIAHDNGEWTKYSHMQTGSTSGKAKLKVGDKVKKGQYLGDEGKVGCAWPAHLHFEVVKVDDDPADGVDTFPGIADPSGKLVGWNFEKARDPRIEELAGYTFINRKTYISGENKTCRNDNDCDDGWCNKGIDTTKNKCMPLKPDNDTCDVVGGGHQCKGGHCKFSRCYTPGSVPFGGTCYVNDACKKGKCSDINGLKGVCVCKKDEDCNSTTEYCDKGLDLKMNQCRKKLAKGKKCGKTGSFGNNHKCLSDKCSGFPKYVCE